MIPTIRNLYITPLIRTHGNYKIMVQAKAIKNKFYQNYIPNRNPRYSHYFSIEPNIAGKLYNSPIFYTKHSDNTFTDSPRRSSKRRAGRKTIYKPSPTVVSSPVMESFSCHSTNNWIKPNEPQSPDYYLSSIHPSSSFIHINP